MQTLLSLRSAVAAFQPDVLHVQCFGPNGTYAAALSRVTGIPLVVTLQGETVMDDADIFETSRVLRASLRFGLRTAAAVTACSAFTLADAEDRFGLAPGRGQVIPNGVDLAGTEHRGAAPTQEATAPAVSDRPYIFALGRVVEKKGFDLLLAAYAAIDAVHRTTDLVIAGTGASLEALRQDAISIGVAPHVHFVGKLNREAVAAAMAGAELFVMPSRLEPFGIVVLEAWRAGVAVVATTHGGPPEFVHDGHDGVLVDPFDTGSFAVVLQKLLSDADHRRTLAEAGRLSAEAFAWPSIAHRYQQVYASVIRTGSGEGGVDAAPSPSHQGQSVR